MENKNIDFVAKHYRKGSFSVGKAMQRMGFGLRNRWRPFRVAVVVASIVVVTAVASIIIRNEYATQDAAPVIVEQSAPGDLHAVRSIDFDNAPLPVVVDKIRNVYGVEVSGLPDDASTYHLTLHYEGNATDLLDTINEILDIKLTVKE